MKLRTRRIFFWSLIPCFLVGGAVAVAYSQGYRIDLKTHAVTKIGALYVRGYPRNATITIDGKPLNTGSWWPLQSGTLDSGLVPGTYKLHAEATGYRSWDADVVIRPALVTERKSLLLFPNTSTSQVATDTPPVAIDTPSEFSFPVLSTVDTDGHVRVGTSVFTGTYIGTMNGRLALLSQTTHGKSVTHTVTLQVPGETTATTISLSNVGASQPKVFDDSILNRESDYLISAYTSTGKRMVFASSTEKIGAYIRTSSFDAWELQGKTTSTLVIRRRGSGTQITLPTKTLVSLSAAGNDFGLLDVDGGLWLVDSDTGLAKEVGHRATLASWRPDGGAVAAVIDGILEVIPLKEDVPHGKLIGALDRKDAKATAITWYPDGEHLFVSLHGATDTLLFADIIEGDLSEQHSYLLPLPSGGAWAFSDELKVLYVTDPRTSSVTSYVFPD